MQEFERMTKSKLTNSVDMFLYIRSFMGFIGAQLFIPKDFIESFIYDLNPPKFLCVGFFIPNDFKENLKHGLNPPKFSSFSQPYPGIHSLFFT
jgi:hypothetical protein